MASIRTPIYTHLFERLPSAKAADLDFEIIVGCHPNARSRRRCAGRTGTVVPRHLQVIEEVGQGASAEVSEATLSV